MTTRHFGYLIEQGPSGVVEHDTATCGHCQHVMLLPPAPQGQVIVRIDGPCTGCGKYICDQCKGKGCDPWEKKMERMEARERLWNLIGG